MKVIVLVVAVVVAACTPLQTRRVSRAALVPHLTPTLMNGAPLDTPGQVVVGASSVGHTTLAASDPTAAVEIPGTQLFAALRGRLGDAVALGLTYERGLDATARPLKATQAPVDGGDVIARGMTMTITADTGVPHWYLGVDAEVAVWEVPWVEHSTCIDTCDGVPLHSVTHGTQAVPQLGLGVMPTYRGATWTVWGGASIRNHPTVVQKGDEYGPDYGHDVDGGVINAVLVIGAEVELGAGIKGGLAVYQAVGGAPVAYGPSLAATVTLPLGRPRRP